MRTSRGEGLTSDGRGTPRVFSIGSLFFDNGSSNARRSVMCEATGQRPALRQNCD